MEQSLQTLDAKNRLALWMQRVSDCRSSGKPVQRWCAENGINHKTYYYWQHKVFGIAKENHGQQFVEMPAVSKASRGTAIAGITVAGTKVEIYSGADEETLGALLRVLQQC